MSGDPVSNDITATTTDSTNESNSEPNSVQNLNNSSVKKVKKSKEISKYIDIGVPRIVTGERQYRTFKEFFYFEYRNKIKSILDYYRILGGLRTTYLNFGNTLVHDAFMIYINKQVSGADILLQKDVEDKIELWKVKYGTDEEIMRTIANELFEMIKNLKMLKWKFMEYCKKRGLVTEADIVRLKDVL